MRMTPLEIQSHQFARRMSGFDRDEVESFLQMVTEDYEALVIENAECRERARRLEERLESSQGQEALLRETLTTAQSMSEHLRSTTEKECQTNLLQAEQEAAEIIRKAERDVTRLKEDIRELHGLRSRMAESLRSILGHHLKWVDQIELQGQEDALMNKKALAPAPSFPSGCQKPRTGRAPRARD